MRKRRSIVFQHVMDVIRRCEAILTKSTGSTLIELPILASVSSTSAEPGGDEEGHDSCLALSLPAGTSSKGNFATCRNGKSNSFNINLTYWNFQHEK